MAYATARLDNAAAVEWAMDGGPHSYNKNTGVMSKSWPYLPGVPGTSNAGCLDPFNYAMDPTGDSGCDLTPPDYEDTVDILLNYHDQDKAGAVIWDTDYGVTVSDHCAVVSGGWNDPCFAPTWGPFAGIPSIVAAVSLMGLEPNSPEDMCGIPKWACICGDYHFGSPREFIEYLEENAVPGSPLPTVSEVLERGKAFKPATIAPEDMQTM
jgi:hypothetical protein